MTPVVIAPRVEDPTSDVESVASNGFFMLRPSRSYAAGGQWVVPVWSDPVPLAGVAVTVQLDPLVDVPYEILINISDYTGVVEIHEFRFVPSSGVAVKWESLTQTDGAGGAVLTSTVEARLAALEAAVSGGGGGGGGAVLSVAGKTGAVTLVAADLTNATATGQAVVTAASTTAARTAIGAGTSSLVIGTTGGTAADGGTVATLTTTVGTKAPLASPTFTGTVTVPAGANPTDAVNKSQLDAVSTSGVVDATSTVKGKIALSGVAGGLTGTADNPLVVGYSSLAPLASPALTGLPTSTTPAPGTSNSTRIATTAFVKAEPVTMLQLPAGAKVAVLWDGVATPVRPTTRTDIFVEWVSTTLPPIVTSPSTAGAYTNDFLARTFV